MKRLLLLFITLFFISCSSDDSEDDGKCWGTVKERDESGDVIWEFRYKEDCDRCGEYMNYVCPEPGTCGDYFGEPVYNVLGTWECD